MKRSRQQPVSTAEEVRVVALIARGDTYDQIQAELEQAGTHISKVTLGNIKKRNLDNLVMLKEKLAANEEEHALKIKQKANERISKRLDSDDKATQMYEDLHSKFMSGEITFQEYNDGVKALPKQFFVSTGELVAVSKEMHQQSKGDAIPDNNPLDRNALAEAIRNGDEFQLNQLIFKRGEQNDQPTGTQEELLSNPEPR